MWEKPQRLWFPRVLEVTGNLEETLRDRELRGETWTLFRTVKKGKTDPVQGVFCERISEDRLSAWFDLVPVLQRLFNKQSLKLDVPNFQAPRVILAPTPGDAPKIPQELMPQAPAPPDPETVKSFREMLEQAGLGQRIGRKPDDQAEGKPDRNGQASQGKNGQ
jgi:hypothetical protein